MSGYRGPAISLVQEICATPSGFSTGILAPVKPEVRHSTQEQEKNLTELLRVATQTRKDDGEFEVSLDYVMRSLLKEAK